MVRLESGKVDRKQGQQGLSEKVYREAASLAGLGVAGKGAHTNLQKVPENSASTDRQTTDQTDKQTDRPDQTDRQTDRAWRGRSFVPLEST